MAVKCDHIVMNIHNMYLFLAYVIGCYEIGLIYEATRCVDHHVLLPFNSIMFKYCKFIHN